MPIHDRPATAAGATPAASINAAARRAAGREAAVRPPAPSAAVRTLLALLTLVLSGAAGAALAAQDKRPMAIADMFKVQRLSDASISPDGKWVVYTVTTSDLENNKNSSDLWLAPVGGGPARQLTTHPAKDGGAAWSPDGKRLAFESSRSEAAQIWLLDLEGGEPRQLTRVSTEASQPVWSPDGKTIAFVSSVFPEFSSKPFEESDALNKKKLGELEKGKVKARLYASLLYRHWNAWSDGRLQHIFVQPLEGGTPRDVTPGERDAVPTSTTFSGGIDFAFSPDGREIAYTSPPAQNAAWSTNHDIFSVPVSGGKARLLTENPAADGYPRYSPDGKHIAYRAQSQPGFESDRWQLMIQERGSRKSRSLTTGFDAAVEAPVWAPDGRALYFEAEERGSVSLFRVTVADGRIEKIVEGHTNRGVGLSSDGKIVIFLRQSAVRPPEVYTSGADGQGARPVTRANDGLFSTLEIPPPESVWYDGDAGAKVQAWLFKPPGFSSERRYPLVYLVHGGPQSAWLDSWSYRWNAALWAAQGYVILAPNPRGSTGFGQQFTNEISRDWDGKVYADLMKGLDYAESLPYVERGRAAAAGGSFGGYMMNLFQGRAGGRFKTLVTHCGIYNSVSMYGTTEELWFEEWDHGGTPWDNPGEFERASPHRLAKSFNTPTLIIHNELDFRVPISEGMQLFTLLQRKGVPSKLLIFPDEGHWVLKPANSELWHRTVFEWLASYLF